MITLLVGENSFEVSRNVEALVSDFNGSVEKYDGTEVAINQLPDLLMGASLFADNRMVIIKNLSENKSVWNGLGGLLSKVSDDVHLVLIESKPDKRTSVYKSLQQLAKITEHNLLTERDKTKVETWVQKEAKSLGFELDKKSAQFLVQWVGVDQWQLFNGLQKLSLVDEVSEEVIKDIIDANPVENVFNLLEVAVEGDKARIKSMINSLSTTDDAYRLAALLSSQVFQLAAVMSAGPDDNPAKDFGIHPYVVSKLRVLSKKLGKNGVTRLVQTFADLDEQLKTSSYEPWLLIEKALMTIS